MSDADPHNARSTSDGVSPAWPPDSAELRGESLGQASPGLPLAPAGIRTASESPGSGAVLDASGDSRRAGAVENGRARPSYVFFAIVSSCVLLLDVAAKAWAEIRFQGLARGGQAVTVIEHHLSFTLAYNKGGAWGVFRDFGDWVRKPFFLAVSALAIAFLVSLYGRLRPEQRSLRWGLPLVLGGALGNLSDRIAREGVVDFIDYRGDWVALMNRGIASVAQGWVVTDHWPTFNVADIGITVGVALMAIDMFVARQDPALETNGSPPSTRLPSPNASSSASDAPRDESTNVGSMCGERAGAALCRTGEHGADGASVQEPRADEPGTGPGLSEGPR